MKYTSRAGRVGCLSTWYPVIMRVPFFPFILMLLMFSYAPHVNAQASNSDIFTTNLSLGSRGSQVFALQKILNRDPDTRIASSGVGSPGNETDYFGSLTKTAVIRFQMKHANEVLAPAGLTQGNGFVGQHTRTKLNALSSVIVSVSPAVPSASPALKPPTETSTILSTASQNPNLKNIDTVLAVIDKVATKQGYSAATIITIKEAVVERLSTTTDLRAAFLKEMQEKSNRTAQNSSLLDKVLATVAHAFDTFFMPRHARAAIGVPFGGAVLSAVPCNGGVWNITLTPLPPTFPVLLAYVTGSQVFLSYNIPFTSYLLGEYSPVPMAYCWIGIYPYPSEGMINPMTGSSPL